LGIKTIKSLFPGIAFAEICRIQKPTTMKYTFLILLVIFLGCKKDKNFETNQPEIVENSALPAAAHPDHIIFVWMENHSYNQVIGSSSAPYINSLKAKGTLFTQSYALTHPSMPNYIRFFSGATQGLTTNACLSGRPYSTANLYTELKKVGKTIAWYSEDLPSEGSLACSNGSYTMSHNPIPAFSNVPSTRNKTWKQFPTDFTKLENVVCISPNKLHDMHDGTILQGDTWVKTYLSKLAEWCLTHNSVFVVYFDEDGKTENNRIPAIAVGQHVKANYKSGTYIDHYNWTHTICSMFYAGNKWTTNLSTRLNISDCWK
jgi:acid phosphatase